MDDSTMKHIVNNIFLPIELPQEDDQSGAHGGTFVRLVADVVAQELCSVQRLKKTIAMMKSWGIVQQSIMDWKAVLKNIEDLMPGETCGLFLPMQNAGLTVLIPVDNITFATLAVYRVAASSSEVMGAPGVLLGTFPGWSVTTHADRVRNASFAKQVADLANNKFEEMVPQSRKAGSSHQEERDVVDARYVTEWLLAAVAGHSLITGETGVKRVQKKIRDDVLWKHGSFLPWRRSGEYMAVKIVLHSTLVGSLGEPDGLIAYKLIMLKVMSTILRHNLPKLDTDVILQMLSKLARRLSKLDKLATTRPTMNLSIHRCVQSNLKEICKLVIDSREKVDERWQNIMKHDADNSEINVDKNKLDFQKDVRHSLQTAWPHLAVALAATSQLNLSSPNIYVPNCMRRNISRSWPDMNILQSCSAPLDIGEALYDIEVWVRDVLFLELQGYVDRPETELFDILVKYIGRAKPHYKDNGDCLGSSRMILTTFTIVAALDRLAGREFPMLHEYDTGVNFSELQFLLLPHRHDMEHLTKVEAYFARRLDKRKFQISLISEDVPSPQSFSVRQAQQDPEVQKRKEQILEFACQEKLKKLEELFTERKKHENLIRTAASMVCEWRVNVYGSRYHYGPYCQKCKLEKEAADMRVSIIEFPLPKLAHFQDAVICELVAPTSSWTTLRDALHVLHRDVLGDELVSCEKQGTWRDYEPLKRWVRTPSKAPLTTLGSTSKLFLMSHYRSPLHPDSHPDEAFFKPNGFNIRLVENSSDRLASIETYRNSGDVRSLTSLKAVGPYKCLQWTMEGTSHTENEVLARQVECPLELNLAEFKAFGTLRAGQRIQIRNIVRVIEMRTVSLSQSSVVNLMSQVLWEAGPPCVEKLDGMWFRDSQLDLRNEAFAQYTLQRLVFLTGNIGDNWKDHLALLSIVTIGARVLAMSEAAWEMVAIGILRKCREIAKTWLKQIEEVLGAMMASPIKEIQEMRSKLVDVAAIAALTFDVDVCHLKLAMKRDEDVIYWLRTIACIHDNVLLNSESSMSIFQRNLLRRVQITALRLKKTLQDHLRENNKCLNGFVSNHWADATQGEYTECWESYDSPREHWWTTTFKHSLYGHMSTLHVDTLRGSFLVNGLPVGRLPAAITSHPDYERVFGCHIFEVQPAAASSGTFVSVYKLKESVFTFALIEKGNRLVVKDRRNNHEFELFPSRLLSGDLPRLLTEQHSHWILQTRSCTQEKTAVCILFRPVKFDDDHFAEDTVPFEINVMSKAVRDIQRDWKLVDIRSTSFREIYDGVLHCLELPSYVHVFVTSSGDVHAELPRMGLGFHIKEGVLWSREQPGFYVSTKQSLGTLIGLRQGVLLIEHELVGTYMPKRSMVMPHTIALSSRMEKRQNFGQHPVVKDEAFEFSSPSFFIYDVDDRLQTLRAPASGTAWLYLALLHALTAHPLPDPFTGLTGAESAMRLLQSPRCWSCKPYEPESISILLKIAELSPRRNWYPPHLCCMQTVTCPERLFPSTALDAFHMIVEKLIEDSKRLSFLFPVTNKPTTLSTEDAALLSEDATLRLKSYWRSRSVFGDEALMNSKFESSLGGPPVPHLTTMNLSPQEGNRLKGYTTMRTLAEAGFQWRSARCEPWPMLDSFADHLSFVLLNCQGLRGATRENFSTVPSVSAWRKIAKGDFANNWINLYNLARHVRMQNRQEEFTFLLSLLAYRDLDYRLLFLLLCVAVHANDFENIDPPDYESYEFTDQAAFDLTMVEAEVKRHRIPFEDWKLSSGTSLKDDAELDKIYVQRQAEDVESLVEGARRSWPNTMSSSFMSGTIECYKALNGIRRLFTRWLQNFRLHEFVSTVNGKIKELSHRTTKTLEPGPLELHVQPLHNAASNQPFCYELPISSFLDYSEAEEIFQAGQFGRTIECNGEKQEAMPDDPHPLFLEADRTAPCKVSEQFKGDLRNSWGQRHKLQAQPLLEVQRMHLEEKLKECKKKSIHLWNGVCDALMPSKEDLTSQALEAAGLWRRVTPVVLLPLLVNPTYASDNWRHACMALGALAVVWTSEQQTERCLRLYDTKDVAFQKELANTSQRNWKPSDRPEWLLLELEGDFRMRKVQVDVTNVMLEPKDAENSVLQLNMGEGKTSVIVPALCASISDGKQFARLTVLSSLFRINFDALAFKLGGLLNRRVYTFPCRRDMKLNVVEVARMETVYLECIAERGVVVTRPEHRLSAQLMALELCRAGPTVGPGRELRELQELISSKVGDVLDESDLILQVKYQVVYTIGEQMIIGGEDLRWRLSQSVLRSARRHCQFMLDEFGPDAIEFKEAGEGKFAFPHIRLLNEELNMSLCERIVDDVLNGEDEDLAFCELRGNQKVLIRDFVLDSTLSLQDIQGVVPEGRQLNFVLIMRGLFCYGVLMHVFRMRWRVEFGVRPSGHPKMAVPFRAKDVPVERAEYGHPDVAIMLTQLSYYNSGLSDEQLLVAFQKLYRLPTRDHEYIRWLKDVPKGNLPETLSDVNLDNFVQRNRILFPMLRRNMRVIDFWLSTTVFPVECRQFERKLVASAWDLCERKAERRPVCGFSGTKDTCLLLPTSIRQRDLPQLQGTDGVVMANLLRKENGAYHNLPSCIDSLGILERINDYGARVLLDVGALMVDLSNREVATIWLAMADPRTSGIEAAIYFDDSDNQIMAVDKNGHHAPLPLSPYHRKMKSCVVYLDDVHTRGTDLKIPPGYHACVTLGRGITKDCLVQACMRMRMLGAGHSVSFWASQEVHTSIRSTLPVGTTCEFTSKDVLNWVTQNSVTEIRNGFRHWGSQGITYSRRRAVNDLYRASKGNMSLEALGDLNVEKEIIDLVQCYGNERRVVPLPEITSKRLINAAMNMKGANGLDVQMNADAVKTMMSLGRPIVERIKKYGAGVQSFTEVLDEEQERELEHEMEEEEEIQRPGAATPHVAQLSPDVQHLASTGSFNRFSKDFLPLLRALKGTSLWKHAETEAWSTKLFITQEFAKVVSHNSLSSGADFLRPVAWIVVVPSERKQQSTEPEAIVLLSSFEVNLLIPDFRRGQGASLHMFAPRLRKRQDFMVHERALVLPIVGTSEVVMDHDLPLTAQLLAFSGSAFFASKSEQSAYCDFLGLCPRPRSRIEEDAFVRGHISLDGFVPPERRGFVKPRLETTCAFEKSPVRFLADLLYARGWLGYPSSSHVGQILHTDDYTPPKSYRESGLAVGVWDKQESRVVAGVGSAGVAPPESPGLNLMWPYPGT